MAAVIVERSRLSGLDRLRGIAIVAMVVDHVCAFAVAMFDLGDVERWLWLNRWTNTRVAMPLFMLCTGALLALKVPSRRRLLEVAAAAVVVNYGVIVTAPGIHAPDILATWTLVMLGARWIRRWPWQTAVLGAVAASTWPWPIGGYHPGYVAALIALGVLVASWAPFYVDERGAQVGHWGPDLDHIGQSAPKWMEPIGRHPLSIYLAHIAVLCALAVLVRGGLA